MHGPAEFSFSLKFCDFDQKGMNIIMKKILCLILCALTLFSSAAVYADEPKVETDAKAVLLMEASSGEVLYEENADEQLPIASVTKIMTMLLIMEAIDNGTITVDDMVTVSDNAMSYGGSTMFLESGEQISVNDMLKGIAVASANDGCVAMAEHLTGSEAAFVEKMNKRAAELGMNNTHFMNTNGLDEDNHYSSARDVAVMSRELIAHSDILRYTSIWTDELRGGKFKLANTNKLVRFYDGANGLKTGSTSKALCCLSATAKRDNMQLIAVVLGSPTSAKRFASARALLDYGFASYKIDLPAKKGDVVEEAEVKKGVEDKVNAVCGNDFSRLVRKDDTAETEKHTELYENITAPIKAGQKIGEMSFIRNGAEVGRIDILAQNEVKKKGIGDFMRGFFEKIIGWEK